VENDSYGWALKEASPEESNSSPGVINLLLFVNKGTPHGPPLGPPLKSSNKKLRKQP